MDETTFFDNDGNVTMTQAHITEQDTFTANGKTLTGVPYTGNVTFYFDNGPITNVVSQGILEKVPLPDGSLFIAARRIPSVGGGPSFEPDNGAFQNLAGFCAALSP